MATDWALEITKMLVTPTATAVGAFIGFRLAVRGKKYDLLYKEKLEAFKATVNEMLTAHYLLRRAIVGNQIEDDLKNNLTMEEVWDKIFALNAKLLFSERTEEVFLGRKSRKSLKEFSKSLGEVWNYCHRTGISKSIGWIDAVEQLENEEDNDVRDKRIEAYTLLGESLEKASGACENLIRDLYDDVNLPEMRPIFEKPPKLDVAKILSSLQRGASLVSEIPFS